MSNDSEREYPQTYEWEDYYDGHGVEIERRFVELQNDAYWLYRAESDHADLAVQAQTVENCLAMMIEEITGNGVTEDKESDRDV